MTAVKLTVHGTGTGTCALSGRESADGLTVSFEGEQPVFVSWRSLKQLLSFRAAQGGKAELRPVIAQPIGNGPGMVK